MKTNQMMSVAFTHGVIKIKHKTMLGSLKDVEVVGNLYRVNKGLEPKSLDKWLQFRDTWEFIETLSKRIYLDENWYIIVKNSNDLDIKSQISQLGDFELNQDNRIAYGKMIKKYPDYIIKSQRGGKVENRGVWANLYILLKFAMWLDKDFELDVIDTFVTNKILIHRDNGGEEFKRLNNLINKLPDRVKKAHERGLSIVEVNKPIYINIAKLINTRVNEVYDKGWNDERKTLDKQQMREQLLNNLSFSLYNNLITSYPQLKSTILNYQFN